VTLVPLTLVETRPEPLPRFEEGAAKTPPADEVARTSNHVGLSGTAAQSPVLTSRRPTASPLFGLYLRKGDEEAALGYRDFLGGLKELKTLLLKDRKLHLKNEVFRVSIRMLLSEFILYLLSNLSLF